MFEYCVCGMCCVGVVYECVDGGKVVFWLGMNGKVWFSK